MRLLWDKRGKVAGTKRGVRLVELCLDKDVADASWLLSEALPVSVPAAVYQLQVSGTQR